MAVTLVIRYQVGLRQIVPQAPQRPLQQPAPQQAAPQQQAVPGVQGERNVGAGNAANERNVQRAQLPFWARREGGFLSEALALVVPLALSINPNWRLPEGLATPETQGDDNEGNDDERQPRNDNAEEAPAEQQRERAHEPELREEAAEILPHDA